MRLILTQKLAELFLNLENQQMAAREDLGSAFARLKEYQANSNQSPGGGQNEMKINRLQKRKHLNKIRLLGIHFELRGGNE